MKRLRRFFNLAVNEMFTVGTDEELTPYEKEMNAIWIRAMSISLPKKGRHRMMKKCFKWLVKAAWRRCLKAGE